MTFSLHIEIVVICQASRALKMTLRYDTTSVDNRLEVVCVIVLITSLHFDQMIIDVRLMVF